MPHRPRSRRYVLIRRAVVVVVLGAVAQTLVAVMAAVFASTENEGNLIALDLTEGDRFVTGIRVDYALSSYWSLLAHTPEERDEWIELVTGPYMQRELVTRPRIPLALKPSLRFTMEGKDRSGGVTAGFPLRSMGASNWEQIRESADVPYVGDVVGGLRVAALFPEFAPYGAPNGRFENLVPLIPILPGFAINTALYAAALYVLFFGFVDVRRFRRARRGACVACGYDLKGVAGVEGGECAECGEQSSKQPTIEAE